MMEIISSSKALTNGENQICRCRIASRYTQLVNRLGRSDDMVVKLNLLRSVKTPIIDSLLLLLLLLSVQPCSSSLMSPMFTFLVICSSLPWHGPEMCHSKQKHRTGFALIPLHFDDMLSAIIIIISTIAPASYHVLTAAAVCMCEFMHTGSCSSGIE